MDGATKVQRYVQERIRDRNEAEVDHYFKVQPGGRIDAPHAFLLEKLAKHLGDSRAGLAGYLLEAAIDDASNEAGILADGKWDEALGREFAEYLKTRER